MQGRSRRTPAVWRDWGQVTTAVRGERHQRQARPAAAGYVAGSAGPCGDTEGRYRRGGTAGCGQRRVYHRHGDAEKRPQRRHGLLRQWASGSKEGSSFYSHAYDMLMGVAADCGEVEVRDAYLEDAERLLLETGYVCPLYFTGQKRLSAPTRALTDGIGGYYFSYVVQQNNG